MQKLIFLSGMLLSVSILNAKVPGGSGRYENADTVRADATITHATVYFGYGAELTHESRVKVGNATKFIVINQLATNIDINSLQISCPENVALLSHRYTVVMPPVAVTVWNKDALRMKDSVQLVKKAMGRIGNSITIEQEILAKTGTLIEAAVAAGGNKTMTGAEVLKLVDYYNSKIERSKTDIFNYRQEESALKELVNGLEQRIASLQEPGVTPRPYGQLVLQVMCEKPGEIPVSLSYYTRYAGWTPVYDIRVNSKTNKVKLVYKASITQGSGIDWKKTKLTLSTGTPNLGVTAPVLSPWYLQLYVPELYGALQGRAAGINVSRNAIQSMNDSRSLKEVIAYGVADSFEQKKEAEDTIDPSTLQQYTTLNEGQLNTSFEIDLPYEIESDNELHSVTIKDEEVTCILKNYAVPRVDKEAYLLAEVANWQNLDLLPGDANIIMDDTYIGKSLIDPNTTADTLNLSLGKDKRLAVKRSLVKELSSLKTSGRDSRQTFTYEIIVKNNKITDVNLLLKDQYPLSTIKEVEVKLEDSGDAIVNEETGVLTWKLALKPGESKKVRITYSVKYPRDKKIVNLK